MGFKKINERLNYNYEAKGTEIYKIYYDFIKENAEIIDLQQAEAFLLPPQAFGDDRKRQGYEQVKQLIETTKIEMKKGYGRSM